MPRIRIKIDPELCIGAASCVTVSPEFFELNADNKAFPKDPSVAAAEPTQYERVVNVPDAVRDTIVLAAQSCPTLAISIFDEETGEQLFPRAS